MQVNNINSQTNFQGMCVNTKNMTPMQMGLTKSIARGVMGSTSWDVLCKKGVDLVILPGKNDENVIVRFLDPISGEFFKLGRKIIQKNISIYTDIIEKSNNILQEMSDIARGVVSRPKVNPENIIEGKTDLLRMNPELLERAKKVFKNPGVSDDVAQEYIIDAFTKFPPEYGYDFNF